MLILLLALLAGAMVLQENLNRRESEKRWKVSLETGEERAHGDRKGKGGCRDLVRT